MKIKLYDQPFVVVSPSEFEHESIGEWLLDHYGDTPSVNIQVFEGEPSSETDITGNVDKILENSADYYTVLESPGAVPTLAEFLWQVFVAVVLVVVARLLAPSPHALSNVNRDQQSPNNSLGSRENKVRYAERVEDIYGTVHSVPSLMMPTYLKYKDHHKYEYGYYCVGRGYYDIADIKDGDTLIASISGASVSVYDPFTSPNSGTSITTIGDSITDVIVTTKRAIEVDGITLKALNQVQLPDSASYTFTPDPFGDIITQNSKTPNFSSCANVGDSIIISGAGVATSISTYGYDDFGEVTTSSSVLFTSSTHTISSTSYIIDRFTVGMPIIIEGAPSNSGMFTVVSKPTSDSIVVAETLVDEGVGTAVLFTYSSDYSGTYTIYSVSDANIHLTTSTWSATSDNVVCSVKLQNTTTYTDPVTHITTVINLPTEYTNWVTLPSLTRTDVWANIAAPNGMYKDNGGKSVTTTSFDLEVEQLNSTTLIPTGYVEVVAGFLTGSVTEERAVTLEHHTLWVGPCRVRMRRTSDYDYGFNGNVVDEVKWVDLYSVSPVSKLEFGNKTTLHTVTEATPRATAVKTRQLNCTASRKLPTYNGSVFSGTFDSTGRHVSGSIYATNRVVDIIGAVSSDPFIGNRDIITDIDMPQIYSVQHQLDMWDSECGTFNYTFDTDNTSFEETVTTIANAAFCIAYRQGGKIRLAFDNKQVSSTALFTHRNKKPNGENITRRFSSDSEYDGVEFKYQDPDTFQQETIKLPLSGTANKYKKFEIPGIRSYKQAWYRANREYQKIIGQRITIDTETTMDARSLLPNSRVDIVDNTRFKSFDGEVVAQNGYELTLSQKVEFVPNEPHSIVLMRRDGSLQSITVTQGSNANKVILQSLPTEAIVTQNSQYGVRTIFSFAVDSGRGAMAYLVQDIDLTGDYAKIHAINYSDSYYSHDTLAIPDKNSVIY